MLTFTFLVTVLAAFGALAYFQARFYLWTAALALLLILQTASAGGFTLGVQILWGLWAVIALLNWPVARRWLLMRPLLKTYRKLLPAISDTEREALDAGTVWWDGELFAGRPNWKRLFELPMPPLKAEEQAFLDGPTEELCRRLDNWQITQDCDLPPDVWHYIKDQGFLGMIIPKTYGGLGFSAQAHSMIVSKIATRSSSAAVSVMVPNSLGPAELLLKYGTEAQKERYLRRLARGEELPCFALTGPFAGSDAASMPDRGIVCRGSYQGKDVLGLRLSWEKRYITLAPVATVLGLAFKVQDPEHLLGEKEDLGITLALVPVTHPGVEIGRRHWPSAQAFQNGPTWGKDVFIPMEFVIGGEERIGQGWRMLMNCLSEGRGISLPALATGCIKFCARYTGIYARVRKQFKLPIGKLEGVEEVLGRMAGEAYAVESARRVTAAAIDQGEKPSVISGLLKYQATERQRQVLNDAMDVHGGRAICIGPSNYIFGLYQALPVSITVEGANILTRSLIVFGQGAVRCHPFLLKEMQAAQDPNIKQAIKPFDQALTGHIAYLVRNAAQSLFHNLTFGRLIEAPPDKAGPHWYRGIERACLNFAFLADVTLLLLGGGLKRKEKLSGRFADILGELYFMTSTLKRFEDEGRFETDLPLVEWNIRNGLYRVDQRLDEILSNYPNPALAWVLRRFVFPLGRWHRPAHDKLGHELASVLMAPSEVRDRLTAGIYINDDAQDVTGRMEHAFKLVTEAEALEQRLREAAKEQRIASATAIDEALQAGIIDQAEADQLSDCEAAVRLAIDVDHFLTLRPFAPQDLFSRRATDGQVRPPARPEVSVTPPPIPPRERSPEPIAAAPLAVVAAVAAAPSPAQEAPARETPTTQGSGYHFEAEEDVEPEAETAAAKSANSDVFDRHGESSRPAVSAGEPKPETSSAEEADVFEMLEGPGSDETASDSAPESDVKVSALAADKEKPEVATASLVSQPEAAPSSEHHEHTNSRWVSERAHSATPAEETAKLVGTGTLKDQGIAIVKAATSAGSGQSDDGNGHGADAPQASLASYGESQTSAHAVKTTSPAQPNELEP